MRRRVFYPGICAALTLLAGAPPAFADTEPNNHLLGAEAIPVGATSVSGQIGGGDPIDFYTFAVAGVQQIHVHETDERGCDPTLLDATGEEIPNDYTTAPGTNRFFVRAGNACSSGYNIALDIPGSVDPGPLQAPIATGEPNDLPSQAAGPLLENQWYSASIDTSNDKDWFTFYVGPGSHQLSLDAYGSEYKGSNGSDAVGVYLYSPGEDLFDVENDDLLSGTGRAFVTQAVTQKIRTGKVTIQGPGQYRVMVINSYPGVPYWLRVTAAGALLSQPYKAPPTSPSPAACAVVSKKVLRGRSLRVRCYRAGKTVRVRFRRGSVSVTRSVRLRRGVARASTRGLRPGAWKISVLNGAGKVGSGRVTIKRR